jgi:hypothetical protein
VEGQNDDEWEGGFERQEKKNWVQLLQQMPHSASSSRPEAVSKLMELSAVLEIHVMTPVELRAFL